MIIIGSGFAGSVLARLFAESGEKVHIIERRKHISGNMFDYVQDGVIIQKYGPHVFHTNDDKVFSFVTKFCDWQEYTLKCSALIDGIETPTPFNFSTVDTYFEHLVAERIKCKLLKKYNCTTIPIIDLLEDSDADIRMYAEFLFQKDYKPYTAKQWGCLPEEIDYSIFKRVPVRLNYDEKYYNARYEGMPKEGFSELFKNLLDHKNIKVSLGEDALKHLTIESEKVLYDGQEDSIIYTGAIDELFKCCYGNLPYRSLRFRLEKYDVENYQGAAVVAYPLQEGYTRITEYTKLPIQKTNGFTYIYKEYPERYVFGENEPYYPVLTETSRILYDHYSERVKEIKNLTVCGRLAEFKYYYMDEVIERAFAVFDSMSR